MSNRAAGPQGAVKDAQAFHIFHEKEEQPTYPDAVSSLSGG